MLVYVTTVLTGSVSFLSLFFVLVALGLQPRSSHSAEEYWNAVTQLVKRVPVIWLILFPLGKEHVAWTMRLYSKQQFFKPLFCIAVSKHSWYSLQGALVAGRNKLERRLQSLRHYGPGPMDTLGNMLLTDINCMYKNYYIFHRCIFDKTFLLLRKLPTFPITLFFSPEKKKN